MFACLFPKDGPTEFSWWILPPSVRFKGVHGSKWETVSLGCVKLGTRKTPRHRCPNGPGLLWPPCSHGQFYFFPRHYRHMRKYFAVSELTRNPNQYPYKGNDWQVSFSGNKWSWNLGRFPPKIIAKKSYGPIWINTNKKQYTLNI